MASRRGGGLKGQEGRRARPRARHLLAADATNKEKWPEHGRGKDNGSQDESRGITWP